MGNCWRTPAIRPIIEKEMNMGNMREISIEECNAVFGGNDEPDEIVVKGRKRTNLHRMMVVRAQCG
jgi:hypothetical protein